MPKRRPRRKQAGNGKVGDFFRKAHDFVKSNRLISRAATALSPIAGPYSNAVGNFGRIAHIAGYGPRSRGRRPRKK